MIRFPCAARLLRNSFPWGYDGEGHYIRSGVIYVPKDGVIEVGTTL
jgi:hypothetical protein